MEKNSCAGIHPSKWERQNGPRPLGPASRLSQESDKEKQRLALDQKRKDMYKQKEDRRGKK